MSVCEDNWDYYIDLNSFATKCYCEFESKVLDFDSHITKQLDSGFKHVILNKRSVKGTDNEDDELKYLIDKNKDLRHEIDKISGDISQQQTQYEGYKKAQKVLSQEIKDKHESFLMAKKCFKKFLKIYYNIESRNGDTQIIYIQFFTEAKKDSENYSVRIERNTKGGKYLLLSTTPKLPSLRDLQRKLEETNDIPGALCSIRQAFMDMKKKK